MINASALTPIHTQLPQSRPQSLLARYLPSPDLPQRLANDWLTHLQHTLAHPSDRVSILTEDRETLKRLCTTHTPLHHIMDAAYFATLRHRFVTGHIAHTNPLPASALLMQPREPSAMPSQKIISAKILVALITQSPSDLSGTIYTAQNDRTRGDAFDFGEQRLRHKRWLQLGIQLFQEQDEKFGTVFFPAFSLIESLMIYSFGDQAVRFCPVPGTVSAAALLDCSLLGYRVVGLPMRPESIAGSILPFPAHVFAEHDIGHGLETSQSVPLWAQKAAILYIKVFKQMRAEFKIQDEKTRQKLKDRYNHHFETCLDLRLRYQSATQNMLGVFILDHLGRFLPEQGDHANFFKNFIECYRQVLTEYFADFDPVVKEAFSADIAKFTETLSALLKQLSIWQNTEGMNCSFRDFVVQYQDASQRFNTTQELLEHNQRTGLIVA